MLDLWEALGETRSFGAVSWEALGESTPSARILGKLWAKHVRSGHFVGSPRRKRAKRQNSREALGQMGIGKLGFREASFGFRIGFREGGPLPETPWTPT